MAIPTVVGFVAYPAFFSDAGLRFLIGGRGGRSLSKFGIAGIGVRWFLASFFPEVFWRFGLRGSIDAEYLLQ